MKPPITHDTDGITEGEGARDEAWRRCSVVHGRSRGMRRLMPANTGKEKGKGEGKKGKGTWGGSVEDSVLLEY